MDLVKVLGKNPEPKAQEFLENGRTDMVAQYVRNHVFAKHPDVYLYQGLLDDRVDVTIQTHCLPGKKIRALILKWDTVSVSRSFYK
jgi:hypothetical protein